MHGALILNMLRSVSYCQFTACLMTGVWLDDEGLYICEAENQFGTIKTEARLSITGLGGLF